MYVGLTAPVNRGAGILLVFPPRVDTGDGDTPGLGRTKDVILPGTTAVGAAKSPEKTIDWEGAETGPCFNGHGGITANQASWQIKVSPDAAIQHELAPGNGGTTFERAIGGGDQVSGHNAAIRLVKKAVTMGQTLCGSNGRKEPEHEQTSKCRPLPG